MAGRQTFRILIVGKSGSGKSTLAKEIVRRMEGRYRQLVVVNRKREFAEFAEKGFSVGAAGDPEPVLARYARVHFHVTGYDPRPFLDALGQAIMRRRDILLVVDEAHQFFERGRIPKGLFEVLTGGPEGPVLRAARGDPHRPVRVSILTGPEGPVLLALGHATGL